MSLNFHNAFYVMITLYFYLNSLLYLSYSYRSPECSPEITHPINVSTEDWHPFLQVYLYVEMSKPKNPEFKKNYIGKSHFCIFRKRVGLTQMFYTFSKNMQISNRDLIKLGKLKFC